MKTVNLPRSRRCRASSGAAVTAKATSAGICIRKSRAVGRLAAAGVKLYVYSSGSVEAQKLLFGHSDAGDLQPLFSGYFDTHVGAKRETASYRNIAQAIGIAPDELLFCPTSARSWMRRRPPAGIPAS